MSYKVPQGEQSTYPPLTPPLFSGDLDVTVAHDVRLTGPDGALHS